MPPAELHSRMWEPVKVQLTLYVILNRTWIYAVVHHQLHHQCTILSLQIAIYMIVWCHFILITLINHVLYGFRLICRIILIVWPLKLDSHQVTVTYDIDVYGSLRQHLLKGRQIQQHTTYYLPLRNRGLRLWNTFPGHKTINQFRLYYHYRWRAL